MNLKSKKEATIKKAQMLKDQHMVDLHLVDAEHDGHKDWTADVVCEA